MYGYRIFAVSIEIYGVKAKGVQSVQSGSTPGVVLGIIYVRDILSVTKLCKLLSQCGRMAEWLWRVAQVHDFDRQTYLDFHVDASPRGFESPSSQIFVPYHIDVPMEINPSGDIRSSLSARAGRGFRSSAFIACQESNGVPQVPQSSLHQGALAFPGTFQICQHTI